MVKNADMLSYRNDLQSASYWQYYPADLSGTLKGSRVYKRVPYNNSIVVANGKTCHNRYHGGKKLRRDYV